MLIPTLRSRIFAKHCAMRLRPSERGNFPFSPGASTERPRDISASYSTKTSGERPRCVVVRKSVSRSLQSQSEEPVDSGGDALTVPAVFLHNSQQADRKSVV